MDSKKKMIIALSSFAMIILATVVAVVAVLAAQNVTIKSAINVSYSVDDVVADVAVHAVKVKTNASSIAWGTAKGTYNFELDYAGTSETFDLGDFSLAKDECVVLKFTFNNNSDKAFTASLTKPTGTNVNIYYSTSEASLLSATLTEPASVNVQAGADKSGVYFAVIKIKDNTKNVNFAGEFDWLLTRVAS